MTTWIALFRTDHVYGKFSVENRPALMTLRLFVNTSLVRKHYYLSVIKPVLKR